MNRLRWWQRAGVFLLLFTAVPFGVMVQVRSAWLKRRMGDVGCFLRAGYAIRRGGQNLYRHTCDNGWHYNYPPLWAIVMAPLADPPHRQLSLVGTTTVSLLGSPGGPRALLTTSTLNACPVPLEPDVAPGIPYVPFSLSVFLCYLLNLSCLLLGVHLLASALSATQEGVWPPGSSGWWGLRLLPILTCLGPVGDTLMRGQTNLVVLLCICGLLAGLLRGQRFQAGLWLAGAACIKIYPLYLLLLPLVRRDGRCLLGCGVGLVVGLGLIPLAVLGPGQTVRCYQELGTVLVGPALNLGEDNTRAKELIEVTATDNQSFRVVMHNTLHRDPRTRPRVEATEVRHMHWFLGGMLTVITVLTGAVLCRVPCVLLHGGTLTLIMLLTSPVCHAHYFALAIPLVMGILWWAWTSAHPLKRYWLVVFPVGFLFALAQILPHIPYFKLFQELGMPAYAVLLLWGVGCVLLRRQKVPGTPPLVRFIRAAG